MFVRNRYGFALATSRCPYFSYRPIPSFVSLKIGHGFYLIAHVAQSLYFAMLCCNIRNALIPLQAIHLLAVPLFNSSFIYVLSDERELL